MNESYNRAYRKFSASRQPSQKRNKLVSSVSKGVCVSSSVNADLFLKLNSRKNSLHEHLNKRKETFGNSFIKVPTCHSQTKL